MKQCEAFISYKTSIIQMEEINGIAEGIVLFNPEEGKNGSPNYKMHLAENILLKEIGDDKLINILDYNEPYYIIDSKGNKIFDLNNNNEDLVLAVLDRLESHGTVNINLSEMN